MSRQLLRWWSRAASEALQGIIDVPIGGYGEDIARFEADACEMRRIFERLKENAKS